MGTFVGLFTVETIPAANRLDCGPLNFKESPRLNFTFAPCCYKFLSQKSIELLSRRQT